MVTNNLVKKIQAVDNGQKFGSFGKDAKRLFIEETSEHIGPILKYLDTRGPLDKIKICDLGGGNGILSKEILKEVGDKYPQLSIDILDIDKSKFGYDNPRINYKEYDARCSFKEKYDLIVARCLLHYNSPNEQRKIFKNISDGLKPDGLAVIIQPIPYNKDKLKVQRLYDSFSKIKKSNKKYWLNLSELTVIIGSKGLKITNIQEHPKKYSLNGFYKKRYSLNETELKHIKRYLSSEIIEIPTYIIQLKGGKIKNE